MNKLLTKIVVLFSLTFILGVTYRIQAIEMVGLYEIEVPVADQSSKNRWVAALKGFKEILVRKSGSRQVLNAYEVQQAYRKVTAYVQRYEYSNNESPDAEQPYTLLLNFAPRLVDELIQEAGMPIWGSNRPVTILWLASEQNFNRSIVTESEEVDSISYQLKENAKRRGIPVILPLMDLEDELSVSISDVWGRFNTPVIDASMRYAADSVVVGRINRVGEQWQARLSYMNQSDESVIEFSEPDQTLLMQTLTNRLTELLCQKYCVVETVESNLISIQISNIGNFANFKRAQGYLDELSSIRKVDVDKIAATHVRFNVSLLGDLQSVKDGISLGNSLVEEVAPSSDPFFSAPSKADDLLLESSKELELAGVDEALALSALAPLPDSIVNEPNGETIVAEEEPRITLYYRWSQ